ncbi:MAG: hypothetical protein O2958_07190 [Gemmatimonadetes bacterium]|nr:hypothetical protein [Gemmatimonadota bacterium]MDA1103838.1 hypothetical protein [Gemmatimonadota bacterium]
MRAFMIRIPACLVMLLAGLSLLWPTDLSGQDRSELSQQRLVDLFSSLSPSQRVQIVTPVAFLDEAGYLSVSQDSVEVSWQGATVPVSLDHIRVVSVQSGHALQGTLWGAGTGLLVGSVAGMLIGSFSCTTVQGCNDAERRGLIRLGGALGLTGGALGFFFGRRSLYWKPVFP